MLVAERVGTPAAGRFVWDRVETLGSVIRPCRADKTPPTIASNAVFSSSPEGCVSSGTSSRSSVSLSSAKDVVPPQQGWRTREPHMQCLARFERELKSGTEGAARLARDRERMWVATHEEQARRMSFKEPPLESGADMPRGGIAGEQGYMEGPSGKPRESSERGEHPQEDARDDVDLPGQSEERGRPRDVDERETGKQCQDPCCRQGTPTRRVDRNCFRIGASSSKTS